MAKRKKRGMTDEQLVALIEERESKAARAGTLNEDQAKALRYYQGLPFGNEVEDRSQVVMREVYSVIEWIMPALLKMFFGSDSVVKFSPKSAEDVRQAEQETDYINHVVQNVNEGFSAFYVWMKEALLAKNSYMVAYWDERTDVTESVYRDLSIEELQMILADQDAEVLESEESAVEAIDPMTGQPTMEPRFTVRLRLREKVGKVTIEALPTERVRIEANYKHVGLARCSFAEYWEDKTISELREAGFDVPDSIADEDDSNAFAQRHELVSTARHARDPLVDEEGDEDADPASREVKVRTAFMRVDFDGDGIAEMRRVVIVGKTILQNEPYDRVCIAALTPTIMPHRHVGMSVAEAVMDLQEIKSTLVRGMLDNMYLANNGRYAINEDTVELADFLTTRPGGVVRVAGDPTGAIMPLVHPVMGAPILQTIEYLDNVLENRTGASPRVLQGQSFDGNAINKTASGISQIMSAAMSRIELIARVFAETGVKELFQIVHMLTLKHARKQEIVQLRNSFIPVDPREWQKRTNMSVEVGLGTGDKQAKIALLQMLAAAQQGVMPLGLSNAQTLYNVLSKIVLEAGYKDPSEFFVNPASGQLQPPQAPPDPKILVEQAKLQADSQFKAAQVQLEQMKIKNAALEAQLKAQTEQSKAFLQAQVDLAKTAMQADEQKAAREETSKNSKEERRARLRETAVKSGVPAPPRRRIVKHHRGPDGRIEASEVIDLDDPVDDAPPESDAPIQTPEE